MNLKDRLQHGWNAFLGRDPTPTYVTSYSSTTRPDYIHLSRGSERSMVNAVLNRIAVDVAAISIDHCRTDDDGRYKEPMKSQLNECLNLAANNDQTGRAFIQDIAMSLLDEGVVAIVPTTATENPMTTGSYDIGSMRVGRVVEWHPTMVKVNLYNEYTGQREDRMFPKAMVALPENPFYEIMNEPNSIYQRLCSKLRQLDVIDSQSASGKLDMIIHLPYSIKSPLKRKEANDRMHDLEQQLSNNKYGIAYIDSTEKITQLNRSIENNLFNQVEYYFNMLLSQLGMPPAVYDGTADEHVMLNYQKRTVEPIISAITDTMRWKFLTKTARTQGQNIMFFIEPFKLATVEDISKSADTFIRNEILTKNEFRQILGFKPSDDPNADRLSNPNMPEQDKMASDGSGPEEPREGEIEYV